jgi:GNAT superfamily N-acetyltransferase
MPHRPDALEQHPTTSATTPLRLANVADAAVLATLRYEFRTGLAPDAPAEIGFHARCAEWMAARLPRTDVWRCWLASEAHGEPLGMVWVQFLEKLPNPVGEPELHAYVTSFYVREPARGRGVGGRLLDAALAACAERGCDTVFLWPTPRSRSLYERHGFSERAGMLELRLWGGAEARSVGRATKQ